MRWRPKPAVSKPTAKGPAAAIGAENIVIDEVLPAPARGLARTLTAGRV